MPQFVLVDVQNLNQIAVSGLNKHGNHSIQAAKSFSISHLLKLGITSVMYRIVESSSTSMSWCSLLTLQPRSRLLVKMLINADAAVGSATASRKRKKFVSVLL